MPATAAQIRRQNVFDVLRAIHIDERATRKSVAQETGLSLATVSSVVADLQARGIVRESALRRQATGRPMAQLGLDPAHGAFVGVDIAETYVHVETYDAALTSLTSAQAELDPDHRDPESVIAAVTAVVLDQIAELPGPPLGIGVSAPGQIDPAGGTSVFAPNWNWHNVPLLDMLRRRLDVPLSLDNPLKLLSVAELWSSNSREFVDFAVVNLGTGVGVGICVDRQVFRGRNNSAGEWGHCVMVADGRACRCGSHGCIEAYTGAPGIIQTIRETAPQLLPVRSTSQSEALTIFAEGIRAGDVPSLLALDAVGHHLGIAVASLVNLLNPDHILLGGWVTDLLGQPLLEATLPHLRHHALAVPLRSTTFAVQHIPGNAVSLGAAYAAMEAYLDSTSRSLFVTAP